MTRWMSTGRWAAVLACASALVLFASACTEPQRFASKRVDPPAPLPAFRLIAEGNRPFQLADLKGHVVVVYVGYTHCPDICPFTMSHLAAARQQLPDVLKDDVKVVMITADPARDTPELMSKYVHYFDPSFIGVSGSTEQVLGALREWGISPECSTPNADGGYTVSHPATSYVLNRDGLLRLQMPHALEPEQIARDLKIVANERTR